MNLEMGIRWLCHDSPSLCKDKINTDELAINGQNVKLGN